jgi:hypothetical protein
MAMRQTPLARLIAVQLGQDLREYVVDARNAGKSWDTIAADLTTATGTQLSNETLRSWFKDELILVLRDSIPATDEQPEQVSA